MKYLAFLTLLLVLPLLVLAQDNSNTDTSFVPLTNVPFLTETGNAFSLDAFLNGLYRISIGVAAVVAVLQIMRAGIMYMGGDSVTEKKEAKNLIALSIGGLILVLSPVVVFSVINPEILTLKIGNIDKLRTATTTPVAVCSPSCATGESCVGGTCLPNNITGDGTCSLTCTQGNECKQGACVPVDVASCPSNIGDGVSVPSITGQNCCAAKAGCSVTLKIPPGGTVLESIPTCSCEQVGTVNVASPMNLVKYLVLANTGTGSDRGPVGNVATLYEQYKRACTTSSKETKEEYSDRRRCNETELRWYTGSDESKPYLWCVPTVMSCIPK